MTLAERRARWRADGAKRRARAFEAKWQLIQLLGGQCARCEGDETTPLTIDHVGGNRTWDLHKASSLERVKRYWAEYRAGVPLRVLCLSCNSEDRNIRARELEEAPF